MHYQTIVIGAGPAGISAAIQLRRAGHNFLIISEGPIGGLLHNANLVENYPGFSDGIRGTELASIFKKHLDAFGIKVASGKVTALFPQNGLFIVRTEDSEHVCENVIVAAGTQPQELPASIYDPETRNKIFYEIYDIADVKNKNIVIIGGGDAAFDYALNICRHNEISVLYRSSKCLPLLHERAGREKTIRFFPETEVVRISKEGDALRITTNNPSYECFRTDIVVAAIGRKPAADFLSDKLKEHFLENREVKGLYYAGDISMGCKRQAAIAVGDGMKAAMDLLLRKIK